MSWGSFLLGLVVMCPLAAFLGFAFGCVRKNEGFCLENSLRVLLVKLQKDQTLHFHFSAICTDDSDDGEDFESVEPDPDVDGYLKESWRNN